MAFLLNCLFGKIMGFILLDCDKKKRWSRILVSLCEFVAFQVFRLFLPDEMQRSSMVMVFLAEMQWGQEFVREFLKHNEGVGLLVTYMEKMALYTECWRKWLLAITLQSKC